MAKRWDVLTDGEREDFLTWVQPMLLDGIQANKQNHTPLYCIHALYSLLCGSLHTCFGRVWLRKTAAVLSRQPF